MAIRTKDQLLDKIAADRIWRIREISKLKMLVRLAEQDSEAKKVICRAGLSLAYAHWEGFVKKVGTYFLEYISMQRLSYKELRPNFVTLSLKSKIDEANASKKYSTFDAITGTLLSDTAHKVILPKGAVNTESNLSSKVLKEIIWCLGLNYDGFITKEIFLDNKLLGRRNHVAHGEEMNLDETDFHDVMAEVITLIDMFRNLVENSITLESYKI